MQSARKHIVHPERELAAHRLHHGSTDRRMARVHRLAEVGAFPAECVDRRCLGAEEPEQMVHGLGQESEVEPFRAKRVGHGGVTPW